MGLSLLWLFGPIDVEPPKARDRPADYALRWSAPEGCPDRAAVMGRVEALRTADGAGLGTAEVDGRISASDDGGYDITLVTTFAGRTDTRELASRSCGSLAEATAILIATALDAGVAVAVAEFPVARDVMPQPSPPPPRASLVPVAPPAAVPLVAPRRRTPMRPLVRATGMGEFGFLGGFDGGASVVFGLAWGHARVEAHGSYLARRTKLDASGRGGRFQGGFAGIRGCFAALRPRLELPLCAGIEAGASRVDTVRTSERRVRVTPWAAPFAALGLVVRTGRARPFVGAELAVRAVGARWTIDGRTAFHQLPVSVRLLAGIEIVLERSQSEKNRRRPDSSPR